MIKNSVPLTPLDKSLEIFGGLFLLAACVIPVIFYSQMPARIPVHFDFGGTPDAYGSRVNLVLMPWIGVALYAAIFVIKRYTNRLNFPVPVTDENREQLLFLTLQMMRWVRLSVALLFLLLVTSSVRVGLGETSRANIYIVIYFLLALAVIVGIYMFRMIQTHREPEE